MGIAAIGIDLDRAVEAREDFGGIFAFTPGACVDAPCLASVIFGLSAGSSIGRVSGL
jgi:hypothetical protein